VTLVEYIQTSIEILMNLKSEEALYRAEREKAAAAKKNGEVSKNGKIQGLLG
jgi:hypothetical protein